MAEKRYITDPEHSKLVRRTAKTILPKRLSVTEFKVTAKSPTCFFVCQFRKPANDFQEALAANNGRAGRRAVIGKAIGGFADELNRKSEKIAQPAVDCCGLIEDEILATGF